MYLYKFNSTSTLWYEEKVLVEKNQLAADTTTNSALGSRVYATDSALFFCDVPRSVNAHLGEEAENSLADVEGKVYVIWADTSGYEEKDSTNDTVWTATVLWALVLVSIPVAVAFALIGYRYRDSFCGAHKSLTDSTGTPSSSTHPSPFLLTSCVESTNTENQGASIIKASPLTHHVFRSQTTKKGNDVESNCSSPAGQETKTSWKFSEMVRGRSNYQQLQVPDSPSCRSEVSTVSITSGSASDPSRADGNWFERLFGWRLVSSEPSTLPSASGRNSDELTDSTLPRSSLQSPAPPLSRSSNPMVSPAVVE